MYFLSRNENKEAQLNLAEVHLKLGEIQLEQGIRIILIYYIQDITRWRKDMNFIFKWQNNILQTNAASE